MKRIIHSHGHFMASTVVAHALELFARVLMESGRCELLEVPSLDLNLHRGRTDVFVGLDHGITLVSIEFDGHEPEEATFVNYLMLRTQSLRRRPAEREDDLDRASATDDETYDLFL